MPDGTLPNTRIRSAVLRILDELPIDCSYEDRKAQLKRSGLGRVVLFYSRVSGARRAWAAAPVEVACRAARRPLPRERTAAPWRPARAARVGRLASRSIRALHPPRGLPQLRAILPSWLAGSACRSPLVASPPEPHALLPRVPQTKLSPTVASRETWSKGGRSPSSPLGRRSARTSSRRGCSPRVTLGTSRERKRCATRGSRSQLRARNGRDDGESSSCLRCRASTLLSLAHPSCTGCAAP